jgi:hypothetical protein
MKPPGFGTLVVRSIGGCFYGLIEIYFPIVGKHWFKLVNGASRQQCLVESLSRRCTRKGLGNERCEAQHHTAKKDEQVKTGVEHDRGYDESCFLTNYLTGLVMTEIKDCDIQNIIVAKNVSKYVRER